MKIALLITLTLVVSFARVTSQVSGTVDVDLNNSKSEHLRAYQPFEDLDRKRAEEEQRKKWRFSHNHVVIRLASKEQLELRHAKGLPVPVPLKDVAGIKSVYRVFPEKVIQSMAPWRAEHPILDRWMLAEVVKGTDIRSLVATLNENTLVDVAEPDYLFQLADGGPSETAEPDTASRSGLSALPESGSANPEIEKQWYLDRSKVKEAWQYLENQGLPAGGSSDVVVAVIDSGVDYTHPDLAPNMWVNGAEIPGNGLDDDGNGIIDDIHGADFLNNSSNHNGDPMDHNGHGTHCAGIISAVADNDLGGVGVAYNSRIMAIKAAQYNGSLTSSDIAESIYYAVENGADIINMSFGSYAQSNLVIDALQSAFSQSVLIAAAGNDGLSTECIPGPAPFFPAAYIYVLGVMAEDELGGRASFSNYDCSENTLLEYEIMAPGTKIYSTLPNESYAAWNGTSMAAPVVAGVAALVRTKYPDKNIYSSRFIMGQVASTGTRDIWFRLNSLAALESAPRPQLTSIDYKIFDDPSISPNNDGDGIIDSGETIELAVTVQNRWGKAEPVTVTLAAQAAGGVGSDPYITWDTDTVDYGAVGNFGYKDNGLIYSPEGVATGVEKPFRFTVFSDTPNEHVIPIAVSISAGNAFDSEDTNAPYLFKKNAFSMVVQRGRVLPSVIEEDLVMTKDNYWLVERPVLIPEGVKVTVTEGTQIQFWSPQKFDIYANPKIQVEGILNIEGNADSPVELFNAASLPRFYVRLHESGNGVINMDYFKILNPSLGCGPGEGRWAAWYISDEAITKATHGLVNQEGEYIWWYDGDYKYRGPNFWCANTSKTQFKNLGSSDSSWSVFSSSNPFADQLTRFVAFPLINLDSCLVTQSRALISDEFLSDRPESGVFIRNSVFLNSISNQITEWGQRVVAPSICYRNSDFDWGNNAVLSELWRLDDLRYHMRFYSNDVGSEGATINNSYWGTEDMTLIHEMIHDQRDDFSIPKIEIEPILTEAPESAWPFVVDCVLSTELEADVTAIGAEEVTFTVTYNRDMNPEQQPKVAFGPEEPFNDFTVLGDWQDARTWVGKFKVNSITGDGNQYMRISGGVAADDAWLVAGDDVSRFRFNISSSGTEALTLQAIGGEGFVDLSWGQDDFDLLAGYNLYRGNQRINTSIIPAGVTTFRDANVEPGQSYDYYFKVVLTDMSESESSNTATGTPFDTIPPVVSHSAVGSSQPNLSRTITADITDNVSVVGASLFYRPAGSGAEYNSREMVNATGNRWTVTLEGSLLQPPGVEYYLSVTDGISTTYSGRAENPYLITVDDKPVVTGLTPNRGPASGGTVVQVTGTNFKEGSTVTFGSTPATEVTFVSSTQLGVITPESIPSSVTVSVTNPGGRFGRLLNGFTFIDDLAQIYLSDVVAESGEFVTVPLGVANVTGLASLGVTIQYDPTELRFSALTKGEFLQDWVLVSNSNLKGEIRLAAASNGVALSGSGALASLEFQVLGQPGASASLSLTNLSLNGGAISPSETVGSVSVEEYVSIGGEVYFRGDSSKPISGVAINLEGAGARSAVSDENGQYLIRRLPFADYQLTYAKDDEINGVSGLDAALVLRHVVGLETLSGYSLGAADVNRDGQVLPIDAYGILRHAAGVEEISVRAGGSPWSFDPPVRTYTNLTENITGQSASAYLIGDVSGNWSASTQQNGKPLRLGLYSVADPLNDKTLARVLLQTDGESLYGAELTLNYDPSLGVTSVKCPDSAYVINNNTPGRLQIALANASGISGDKVLVEVEFNESVATNRVILSEVSLQEGQYIVGGAYEEVAFDQDGDGLLDGDEQAYFKTNPQVADSDGDGWIDGDEVNLSYEPTRAGSVPIFEANLMTNEKSDGSVKDLTISFVTRTGGIYYVEESTDLVNWSVRGWGIAGSGVIESRSVPMSDEKTFLRVRELAP